MMENFTAFIASQYFTGISGETTHGILGMNAFLPGAAVNTVAPPSLPLVGPLTQFFTLLFLCIFR